MQLVALLPFPTFSIGIIDFYFVPGTQRKSVCCRMLHAHEKSCICILPLTYLYLIALFKCQVLRYFFLVLIFSLSCEIFVSLSVFLTLQHGKKKRERNTGRRVLMVKLAGSNDN